MEYQDTLVRVFDGVLAQSTAYLASLPTALVVALLVIPIFLAAVSKRPLVLVAALSLVMLAAIAFSRPEFVVPALAVSSYIGSLLIVFLALWAGRKARATRAELDALRSDIDALSRIEERRQLLQLRSNKPLWEEPPLVQPTAAPISPPPEPDSIISSRDASLSGSGSHKR